MSILIYGGTIVNEGRSFRGSLVIDGDSIAEIYDDSRIPRGFYSEKIDATGSFVLPGVIDEHVHFRDPGLTRKADMATESRAAAYGGVTSFFDMPNTVPQTVTPEALEEKFMIAGKKSHVNYSFFFGATNGNVAAFKELDIHRIPGIKLFMGASTGNMLVDGDAQLEAVFAACAQLGLPLMTHCEDTEMINRNMETARRRFGDDPPVTMHPTIRSEEACLVSTAKAVRLAEHYKTRLHVAHVTTKSELLLFGINDNITAEATVAHLLFSDADYAESGTLIKCNPAVKTVGDREALRKALTDGSVYTIGTDHAPHELADKQGGCSRAASGMPMIQFSLPAMLGLVDAGVLDIEKVVELMCHHPAKLFGVRSRGFLRKGYKADVVVVTPHTPWVVTEDVIQSKCKWSPVMGNRFEWQVQNTICNGKIIYDRGFFDADCRGEEIRFR